jgi:hypothetical protein
VVILPQYGFFTTVDKRLSSISNMGARKMQKGKIMNEIIQGIHLQLLSVILNKCKYFGKLYIFPNQETLLDWFNGSTRLGRCVRTLNYLLRRMEDKKLIRRIRRQHNHEVLGHVFKSTIYQITKKGLHALDRFGVDAFKIVKRIRDKIDNAIKKPSTPANDEGKRTGQESMGTIMAKVMSNLKPP